MQETKVLGFAGESLVARFLEERGFRIIEQNYTSSFGEVDVIAEKGEIIAFVEVKTRRICYFPVSIVVTPGKQKKIVKTAKFFFAKKNIHDKVGRFDVATVLYKQDGRHEIDYIENAFYG